MYNLKRGVEHKAERCFRGMLMMKHKKAGCFVILDSDLDREWLKASQSFNLGKKKDSALLKRVLLRILKHVQTADTMLLFSPPTKSLGTRGRPVCERPHLDSRSNSQGSDS